MNRLIERELAAKTASILADVNDARRGLLLITECVAGSLPRIVDPMAAVHLVRLAGLVVEYNTLQALQAEIDS